MYMYKCTHTCTLHVYVNSTCLSLDIFPVYEQKCTCTHSVMTCTYMYMYVCYKDIKFCNECLLVHIQ